MVVQETYSNNENTTALFEIKVALHDLRQGGLSVTKYFNCLTPYWQQLDMFDNPDWECLGDATSRKLLRKREFSNSCWH